MTAMAHLGPPRIVGDVQKLFRSEEHLAQEGLFELSVAVCFANSEETLPAAIDSLRHQRASPPFELLLVTNGTTDESVHVALEASGGLAVHLVSCESIGYDANARNVAMTHASADKIVFLDSDDLADERFVATMSAALDKAAVVTACWELGRLNSLVFPELTEPTVVPLPFHHAGWPYAPAGTLGLRRAVAVRVGGFDPDLSYAANNEWCFRAHAAGYSIVRADGALVAYRLRSQLRTIGTQSYRWGLWSIAAERAAGRYGLPRQGLGVAIRHLVGQTLRTVVGVRTPYGRMVATRSWAGTVGRVVGKASVRLTRLRRAPARALAVERATPWR